MVKSPIDDNMRTALVADALGMAITRRRPTPANSTIMHSDHGSQFTSWAFGALRREPGVGSSDPWCAMIASRAAVRE